MDIFPTIPHKLGEVTYELRPYYGIKIFEAKDSDGKAQVGVILEDIHGPHGYLVFDDEMLDGLIKHLNVAKETTRIKNTW